MADTYWSKVLKRRLSRRRAIIGTGLSAASAAFLIACGSDDEDTPAGLEHCAHMAQHGNLVAHVVQRIRHDDAIQRRQVKRLGEVGDDGAQGGGGKALLHGAAQRLKCAPILVNGMDCCPCAKQIGKSEGKGAAACAQVGPNSARYGNTLAQQFNVISMYHGAGYSGSLAAGSPMTSSGRDGESLSSSA